MERVLDYLPSNVVRKYVPKDLIKELYTLINTETLKQVENKRVLSGMVFQICYAPHRYKHPSRPVASGRTFRKSSAMGYESLFAGNRQNAEVVDAVRQRPQVVPRLHR
ncbi:hypothetical protein GE061_008083 [Apolygus lucorum]|uniref:Uncharacterized protein n=1 Tax=Apolygus lucorum TaxID=248454 RepID=A0A8S9WSF7_APOLU|nr:hypothetical protein GE061_008083 [Apolygus lucorum]